MNCPFYYSMLQRIYLSKIKSERCEAERLEHELDRHVHTCPACNGLNVEPLASNLFRRMVFVVEVQS